jgi:hypothetical protein
LDNFFYFRFSNGFVICYYATCRFENCFIHVNCFLFDKLLFVDHFLHCRDDQGAKSWRHDRLRDAIYNMASSASSSPKKEMPYLIPGTGGGGGTQSRPDVIFVLV